MKKLMNFIALSVICSAALAACGGRTANPVMVSQFGDMKKSCRSLEFEMTSTQGEIQRLLPKTDKTGKNVALGVAGWFLIVPWFFMDFKNAEAQEYEAYRQRYNHLASIALDKNCDIEQKSYPSVEEMKKKYDEMKAKKDQEDKKESPEIKDSY